MRESPSYCLIPPPLRSDHHDVRSVLLEVSCQSAAQIVDAAGHLHTGMARAATVYASWDQSYHLLQQNCAVLRRDVDDGQFVPFAEVDSAGTDVRGLSADNHATDRYEVLAVSAAEEKTEHREGERGKSRRAKVVRQQYDENEAGWFGVPFAEFAVLV